MWDGDGSFRSLPYTTLDVTSSIQLAGDSSASRTVVIALETMAFKATANPEAIFVLRMQLANGAGVVTVASDGTWQGFNGDVHRKPTRPPGGSASYGLLSSNAKHSPPLYPLLRLLSSFALFSWCWLTCHIFFNNDLLVACLAGCVGTLIPTRDVF